MSVRLYLGIGERFSSQRKKFNSKGKPVKSTITVIITEERLPFLSWPTVHDLDSHGYPSADFYNQMNYNNTWS